ncbi:fluoride efflux transporter CrcB [Nocardioides humi]|uniref:Fluoride-specific ion channel FluC n=1 Tax=Nocardioides humi TaxID=449461 RepID=A0ABN1ZPZ3_9ACTN|nr:fluoride efflux transporter CrcB [Nocardioides humi]
MTGWLLVCVGAAAGAPARYLVDRFVQVRHSSRIPWGTLAINLSGSLLLGCLYGGAAGSELLLLVGTGFCGAFTTFSTFAFESVRLLEERASWAALANLSVTLLGGLGAAFVGFALTASW